MPALQALKPSSPEASSLPRLESSSFRVKPRSLKPQASWPRGLAASQPRSLVASQPSYTRTMSPATRRAASLIVGLAMTFTPGVVLACAALLCAPSGHHVAVASERTPDPQAAVGHEHHHLAAGATAVAPRPHEHGSHATVRAGADTPAFPVTPRVDVVPHSCCASNGAQWAEPALVSTRIDLVSHVDALLVMSVRESERGVASAASGPPPYLLPLHPSISTRVLRI